MNCTLAQIKLISLHNQADAAFDAMLSDHLQGCRSCLNFSKALDRGFDSLTSDPGRKPETGFFDRLEQRRSKGVIVSAPGNRQLPAVVRLSPAIAAAAASVLLGIWLGGRLFFASVTEGANTLQLTDSQREVLLASYASDLQLTDESTTAIESYLYEPETLSGNGNK